MNKLEVLEAHTVQDHSQEIPSPLPQHVNRSSHKRSYNKNTSITRTTSSTKSPKPKLPKVSGNTDVQVRVHPSTIAAANTLTASKIPISSKPSSTRSNKNKTAVMDSTLVESVKGIELSQDSDHSNMVPSHPSGPSQDTQNEMAEALQQLQQSSVPQDLSNFLAVFQKGVNEGLDFLKQKITDPASGLEARFSSLSSDHNTLKNRVDTLEDTSKGFSTRLSTLESKPQSSKQIGPQKLIASPSEARIVNQLITKTNTLEKRIVSQEFQSQVLINWADMMYLDHRSLQKQVNFAESTLHNNEVIIGGMYERANQGTFQVVKSFLHNKLLIEVEDGNIFSAHRLGKQGKTIQIWSVSEAGEVTLHSVDCPRHVVIKCAPKFKSLLMDNKKKLAGQVDPKGFKYFIAQYLPEAFKAAQAKHCESVNKEYTKNLKRAPENRVPVCVVGPDLLINNRVITGLVHPPSPGDLCHADKEYHHEFGLI